MSLLPERRPYGLAPRDRRPVGPDFPPSFRCPALTEGRSATYRCTALLRRDSLDTVNWRALERIAQTVWQPQHMLATAAGEGSQRRAADAVAGLVGPIE